MQFPSLITLFQHVKVAWRRFPAASFLAVLFMVTSIVFIERTEKGDAEAWILRLLITAALGMPLLLSIAVAAEAYRWTPARTWMLKGLAVLALGWYYTTLTVSENNSSETDGFRFFALALAVHCGVAVAAYLTRREGSVLSFWEFNKILLAQWMVAAFYGLVLYVGISLAILGVDQLFGLDWSWRIYLHLFIVIAAGFHPLYFLSQMPKVYDLSEEDPAYTAAIRNLVKYILIPLTLLYLLILYAYIIKIGMEWAWPKGYVSSLSLGFSLVGMLTYLLNYRLVETDDSTFLAWFRRWFFYLLSPVVPVLLLAIGRRLSDYGVTEPRYFVATLGLWLLATCLYFIVSKKDDIRFIPISLGLVAFLSVVGPWGATPSACRSQLSELERLLSEKGLLSDGKAKPGAGSVTEEERSRLYSAINFLSERDAMGAVQSWFSPDLDSVFAKEASRYEMSTAIIEYLKLEMASATQKSGSLSFGRLSGSLPVKGYEKLFRIELGYGAEQEFKLDSVRFSLDASALLTLKTGKKEEIFDLTPYLQQLMRKHTDTFYYANIEDMADASVQLKGKRMEIMLLPENLDYEMVQNKIRLNNIRGILLVKQLK